MNGTVQSKKLFSLQEILNESPEWEKSLADSIWARHIRTSPNWRRLVNLDNRLQAVERRLGNIEKKLSLLLINGGNGK